MSRHIYQGIAQDGTGRVIESANITVYLDDETTLATIYSAVSGGTADADSIIQSDTYGAFSFYVDASEYMPTQKFYITITKTGYTDLTLSNVKIIPDETYVYYCDATATDQGAATTRGDRSLKDIVDAIGSTKNATITFPHSGTGNTTVYTFSTTITPTANIKIVPEEGARFTDDASNATLTINGGFEAGHYQVFDWGNGTGDIYITELAEDRVNAKWFGITGDNSTNETAGLTEAIHVANMVDTTGKAKRTLYIPAGTYRVTPGGLPTVECSIDGPNATIAAIDNTNAAVLPVAFSSDRHRIKLHTIIGYDIPYYYTYDDTITPAGIGLHVTRTTAHYNIDIDRIIGFDKAVHFDGTNQAVSSGQLWMGELGYSNYGFYATTGAVDATGRVENNRIFIDYLFEIVTEAVHIDATAGALSVTNWFEIGAMELHWNAGTKGIVLSGETRRNTFRVRSITPNATGNIIETVTAHDNIFQLSTVDWDLVSMDAYNIFDMHTYQNSDQMDLGATPFGRSMIRANTSPSAGRWRAGDIAWNDSPEDGVIGWVCLVSGVPGTWTTFGNYTGQVALTTTTTTLVVQGKGTVWADASGGHVVLGGLSNGVINQRLTIVKKQATNNLTLTNNGAGTQKIYVPGGADLVFTGVRGAAELICDGTHWYVLSSD